MMKLLFLFSSAVSLLFSCAVDGKVLGYDKVFSTLTPVPLPLAEVCATTTTKLKHTVNPAELKWTRTRVDALAVCLQFKDTENLMDLCDDKKDAMATVEVLFKSGSSVATHTHSPIILNKASLTSTDKVKDFCYQYTPCDVYKQLEGYSVELNTVSLEVNIDIAGIKSADNTIPVAAIVVRGGGIDVADSDVPAEYSASMPFFGGFTIHYPSELCDGKVSECNFSESAKLYSSKVRIASIVGADTVPSCEGTSNSGSTKLLMIDFIPSTEKKCLTNDKDCMTEVAITIKEVAKDSHAHSLYSLIPSSLLIALASFFLF